MGFFKNLWNIFTEVIDAVNPLEGFIDNVFLDKVSRLRRGAVLYCDLPIGKHSGIYVGKKKIVHLNGDGTIEKVSPRGFIDRLGGLNTAMSIYVSCAGTSAVGSPEVADRALNMVGNRRNYNVILDNCHQFSAGCLTGDFDNSSNSLSMLRNEARTVLDTDTWRVWDLDSKELFG